MLDVRSILYAPGKKLDFQFDLDLSDLDFAGERPIQQPVSVTGFVRNGADVLTLNLTASTVLHTHCDRCGKELNLEKTTPYTCVLAQELQDEDNDEDLILLQNGFADVETLARDAFILSMDTKILCQEDCKGLCPRCGADLNLGPCGCPDFGPSVSL